MSAANLRIQRTTSSYVTFTLLSRPSQTSGLDRCIPQPSQLVIQLEQRDRAARHLERRDVRPDQIARDRDPALVQEPLQVVVDDVKLDEWRSTHAVDEREHLVTLLEWQVADDRRGEPLDNLGRGRELHALSARLAVNADSDLHLVVAELKRRLPRRRDDARRQR